MPLTVNSLTPQQFQKLSPMMRQYLSVKAQYPECIVMFRLGDFYEMFFDDAINVSAMLGLTLTGRDCGLEERAPMCGVPYHAYTQYMNALNKRGMKVAICEQMQDPALAQGLVERGVTRVVTPGTVTDEESLDEKTNNFIVSIYPDCGKYGLSYSDISVGSFFVMEFTGEDAVNSVKNELSRINPTEVIYPEALSANGDEVISFIKSAYYNHTQDDREFDFSHATKRLCGQFNVSSLNGLGIKDLPLAIRAGGALLSYFTETQMNALRHISKLNIASNSDYMRLDDFTRNNLELLSPLHYNGSKESTLLYTLDFTQTAMGGRLIKQWISLPLQKLEQITDRLNAVDAFINNPLVSDDISNVLKGMCDIERMCSRMSYGTLQPKNLAQLRVALIRIKQIKRAMEGVTPSAELSKIREELSPLDELYELLNNAIKDDPTNNAKEGGIIRDGFDEQVDEYRRISGDGKQWLNELEERERAQTGIRTLRIGYNRVFGYYFEVSKAFMNSVPDKYIRKQTLANSERYFTAELKELEDKAVNAEESCIARETEIFNMIQTRVTDNLNTLKKNAELIAELDVFMSFAVAARKYSYVKPTFNTDGRISLKESRHPMVERTIKDGFNPNDVTLDMQNRRIMVLTGPNMAGKSTYMRQIALAVLMAHIGCFVPAKSADLCVVDRIFTRVGASDNLSSGQSTFMVEMSEMACILNTATQNSLLILDEIGRGTATFDGLSIAWAVLEHIANVTGAKTMFATHYHELTVLDKELDCIKNYSVAVKEIGDNIVFLHKIIHGGADRSFGIQVAALAGLPNDVVKRAKEILRRHEGTLNLQGVGATSKTDEEIDREQAKRAVKDELYKQLSDIDPDSMSPRDAFNFVCALHSRVSG